MRCQVESYGATDIGRRRQTNQDTLYFDDQIGLYVVADGMGGHSAGEVASELAVDAVRAFVIQSRLNQGAAWPYGIDEALSHNGNCLRTAVMLANHRVWQLSASNPEMAGMGTTIVAAIAEEDVLTLASAGDSRAYRIRENSIRQMTKDDSWIQAAVDKGLLQRDQVRNHAMKNVITKAIGASEHIAPHILEESLRSGDFYLFCSDGLHGMINDADILELILEAEGDVRKAVRNLVSAANSSGGKDNITALLLHYKPIRGC